jgi:hypothetical protein
MIARFRFPAPRRARAPAAGPAAALVLAVTACGHAEQTSHPIAHLTETIAMTDPAAARIETEGVRLDAVFQADPGAPLRVRYTVRNTGPSDLAVFDRGDRHAVLTGRHRAGEVGDPGYHDEGGGNLTVSHAALPLPSPSPTLPPVPLAAKLAPGQSIEDEFTIAPPMLDAPRRVRWCLGVADFDETRFTSPEQIGDVHLWQASFELAGAQRTLCTPWFDVARRRFEDGGAG